MCDDVNNRGFLPGIFLNGETYLYQGRYSPVFFYICRKKGVLYMSDSLSTKKALADALKEQLKIEPLDKICIAEICDRCELNRKSFYYHFEDKFDLINWIFDNEYLSEASKKTYTDHWESINSLCRYLYLNKCFYKKAIKVNEHNSFTNHLKSIIKPLIKLRLEEAMKGNEVTKFQLNFYTDAFIFTIARWLLDPNLLPYDEFLEELKSCIYMTAAQTVKEFENT